MAISDSVKDDLCGVFRSALRYRIQGVKFCLENLGETLHRFARNDETLVAQIGVAFAASQCHLPSLASSI
jgi:hypothetical protein